MKENKDRIVIETVNEDEIIGVVDGKELPDELIKSVYGGAGETAVKNEQPCDH